MAQPIINIRVPDHTRRDIEQLAADRGDTIAGVARALLRDGLAAQRERLVSTSATTNHIRQAARDQVAAPAESRA